MDNMDILDITKVNIAKDLLSIHAVFLRPDNPFVWASGIRSPIYCDNRLILSSPEIRTRVKKGLAALIQREYPDCELIAGTAIAGVPHAALVADLLGLPMCYVRPAAKDHGRQNRIEGRAEAGQKVVVIEDLISTAGSVLNVVDALRDIGCDVLGIASIFTYSLATGLERMKKHDVRNVSLTDFETLIQEAVTENYLKESDLPRLRAFRENPRDEGWMQL